MREATDFQDSPTKKYERTHGNSKGALLDMKDNLKDVGIWGQRHYQYLKEAKLSVICVMRLNGSLNTYLQQVNEQADEMSYRLVEQMAKDEGVTEELKRRDQLAWVGAMNNIRDRVNEIVLEQIIYY